MKKYTIKNYKGNLVESLKKFSKKYKGMRIVEAKQDGKMLKIKADLKEAAINDVSFNTITKKYEDIHFWLETQVFGSDTDKYEFYHKFWELIYRIDNVLKYDVPKTVNEIEERAEIIKNAIIEFQKVIDDYRPENTDEFNEIHVEIDDFLRWISDPVEGSKHRDMNGNIIDDDPEEMGETFYMIVDTTSMDICEAFEPYAADLAYHIVNNLETGDTLEDKDAWSKDFEAYIKRKRDKRSSFRKDTKDDGMYMRSSYKLNQKWNSRKPSKFRFNNDLDKFLQFVSFGRLLNNEDYSLEEFQKDLEDFAKGTFLREDEETNESLYDYADEPLDGNETGDPVGMRFSNIKELADALAEYVKSEKEMGWNYNFLHVRDVNSNEEVEVKKANVNGAVAYWGNGHLVISFGEK